MTGLSEQQLAEIGELIKNALSEAGAFCGACGFQPGDRAKCRDCERCLDDYAKALLPLLDTSAERVPALLSELGAKGIEIERLRIEHDRDLTNVMDERDHCEGWADRLANAVGPIELISEHSSHNNPWANALEWLTPHAEVEQLRARVAELEAEQHSTNEALSKADEALRAKDQRIKGLEARLFQVGMARRYRLESGKDFVYVEDIRDAVLGVSDAEAGEPRG